jgi:hypothetical protein
MRTANLVIDAVSFNTFAAFDLCPELVPDEDEKS